MEEKIVEERIEEKIEEKKVKVLTSECFEILRVITKLGIRKELVRLFKESMSMGMKVEKLEKQLLDIAHKEHEGNMRKAVESNIELADKYDQASEERSGLLIEGLFLVLEHMPNAEKEVKNVIAKVNGITLKEVNELEAYELIEKLKAIVTCDSFARFFSTVAK